MRQGVAFIVGGLLWMAGVFMAEGMRPTGGEASELWPALFGLVAITIGALLIIYR